MRNGHLKTVDTVFDRVKDLEHLIKLAPEQSRVMEFDPELAEYVLTRMNDGNRPMKPGIIRSYARAMNAGHWGLTGDTIKFGTNSQLLDGQNRLAAVRRSGVTMRTHVVFGIEPKLFANMDIGKNRTPADVLHIAGVAYAPQTAATVRWLKILNSENPGDRGAKFSNDELLEAIQRDFDQDKIKDSVKIALEVKNATGAPVGNIAALHYLFSQEDKQAADQFMQDWALGRGGMRAPTTVLQKALSDLMVATNNRIHENVRNAMVIRAYLAHSRGEKLKLRDLQFRASDPLPELRVAA